MKNPQRDDRLTIAVMFAVAAANGTANAAATLDRAPRLDKTMLILRSSRDYEAPRPFGTIAGRYTKRIGRGKGNLRGLRSRARARHKPPPATSRSAE